MTDEEFWTFSKFLRERSGIVLTRDKEYLLESRLMPVARRHKFNSLSQLFLELSRRGVEIEKDVVEAMTTNESFFFRDMGVFERLRKDVMPSLIAARAATRKIRIWCAACSSGQEPYSIAMILRDEGGLPPTWQLDIVATDLSTQMIERAQSGIYNHFEVQRGLPIRYLKKYFAKDGDSWRIDAKLRDGVTFRPFNLLREFAMFGVFDVIFCRNVLIYFETNTKRDILDRMSRQLRPEGYLFLGGAETVMGVTERFVPRAGSPGLYVQSDAAAVPVRMAM